MIEHNKELKSNCNCSTNVNKVIVQEEDGRGSCPEEFQEHLTQYELNNGIYQIHSIFNQEKTRKEILKEIIIQAYNEQYSNHNSALDLLK